MPLRVAIVSRDRDVRAAAARAFDAAPASWLVRLHETPPEDADVVVVGPDVSGLDGIAFDPAEPTRILSEVTRATATAAARIVVTGAGGGAGATTVALHLARALSGEAPACVIDLDRRWGLHDRLGIPRDGALSWVAAGEPPEELRRAAVPVAGLRVLLAPSDPGPVFPGPLIDRASSAFGRVVLDAPAVPELDAVAGLCDLGLIVMPPSLPGARRARSVLERVPELEWGVITNRTGPGGETTRSALEDALGRPIILELPCAPRLRDAEDTAALLDSPLCRWSRGLRNLARAVEER